MLISCKNYLHSDIFRVFDHVSGYYGLAKSLLKIKHHKGHYIMIELNSPLRHNDPKCVYCSQQSAKISETKTDGNLRKNR